jgi:GNAT superfamily N-acetyltransferase
MESTLIELAEEPGLWIPQDPTSDTILADGYVVVTWGKRATVERIRLQADAVPAALAMTRALPGLDQVTWWVGEHSTPAGLAEQLLAAGLEPDKDAPELTSLTIGSRPAGEPAIEVLRVTTFEDYLRAVELDWEVWNVSADVRETRQAKAAEHWRMIVADGRVSHYLALVDGEPAGFGRAVFTPFAAILMGGATLPAARGRGVYTSLVHARWAEAVERGTPRITVSAGAMSAPILQRMGFMPVGKVRLLVDRLNGRA